MGSLITSGVSNSFQVCCFVGHVSLRSRKHPLVGQSSALLPEPTMSERDEHAGERAILILYATETGNSLDAAERIAREVRRWHFHTRLASTDTYPLVSRILNNT